MADGADPRSLTPNRYTLHDEIGTGGMASVYLGRAVTPSASGATVAIKRLHPHLARDQRFVAMLLAEADLASRIRHPNVVAVLDVVALQREFILVMEYVHGETLARLLGVAFDRRAPLPPAHAVRIALDVLHGLHAAHEATDEAGRSLEVVHRDVSPHNVMVGVDGVARVLDFGVAKAARRLQTTRTGETKGKISYMAPEQLLGGTCDRRVDVHAVAVMLWEMLVGERLFGGDNEGLVVARIVGGELASPAELVEGVSVELGEVVVRGLAKEPAERFPTAAAMASALEAVVAPAAATAVGEWVRATAHAALAERDVQLSALQLAAADGVDGPTGTMTLAAPPRRSPPRRVWLASALAALTLGAVGASALLLRSSPMPPPAVVSPPLASAAPSRPAPLDVAPGGVAPGVPRGAVARVPSASAPTAVASAPTATRPALAPVRTVASAAPAGPSCVPPYTVDAHGIRRVRVECLGRGKGP